MALFKKFKSLNYQWTIWKQEESIEQLLIMLPDYGLGYKEQLNKFSSESRKKEWLSVRVLLYKMLGSEKEIAYYSNGRPYLTDNSAFISISHTKGYVTVIVSKDVEVGIDIEVITSERILRVVHKFVKEEELPKQPEKEITDIELYTLIWSAKETMFKCMNTAEVDFREHLHVDVAVPFFCKPYLNARETITPNMQMFRINYMIQEKEFVMTWTHL